MQIWFFVAHEMISGREEWLGRGGIGNEKIGKARIGKGIVGRRKIRKGR